MLIVPPLLISCGDNPAEPAPPRPAILGPVSIRVLPASASLSALDETVQLTAEVRDRNGQPVSGATVEWASSADSTVVVGGTGLARAAGNGEATISASTGTAAGTAVGNAAILVRQIASSVVVAPSEAAIAPGATLRLKAEAFDGNAQPVAEAEFSWRVSNPAVAIVDATGLVVGTGDGLATITAQAGHAEGASRIAVGNPDRTALTAFYSAADGPNWSRSGNWLTDAPLAEWYGVDIDARGRVSRLNLTDNNVGGRMTPELRHLTGLTELILRRNRLGGPIPQELGELQELEVLSLASNNFTGSIPAELRRLGNLRRIDLGYNLLTGSIPGELGQLGKIESLSLQDNQLTGPIPRELGNAVTLRSLDVRSNRLTGRIPTELGRLSALDRLVLGQNELMGAIPPQLGTLPRLEILNLGGNQLSSSIPAALGKLTNLRELSLAHNQITGAIPKEFGNLSGLHELRLSSNLLTGVLPRNLVKLGGLGRLEFDSNDGLCAPGTVAFVAWIGDIEWRDGPLCNESDRAGLIALFEATSGGDWTRSEGWLGDGALTEWYGVAADSLGHVRTLALARNGLAGRVPSALAQLAQLKTLRIEDNALEGRLPMRLAKLPLHEFRYSGTESCAPPTHRFQAWLDALPVHDGTGLACGSLSDRDILVALYEGTGGSRWRSSARWLTDAPVGQWLGVSVDHVGRVVGLDLRANGLTGTIPPELGSLATLRELILAENELTGPIPPALWDLTGLRVLDLSFQPLTGPIPPELAGLSDLEVLRLGANALTGTIPSELGNLNRLRELNLSFQPLTGPIPPEFGDLTRLRELDLSRTQLRGAIPPELGNLVPLRKLRLGHARLMGTIPPTLGNLQNLDELDVSGNQLQGWIPPALGNLRSLRRLNLYSNRLSGPIPPTLGKLGSLDSLSVQDNRLTGAVPSELAGLSQLIFMNLSSNAELSGPLPLDLTTLPQIRTLLVGGTGLCTSDNYFRTWLTRRPQSYVPFCPAGEGEAIAYLTQAVQPLAYGVPLVADERALLRVFLTAARTTSLRIPPVRATFYLNGLEAHVAEITAGSTAIATRVDEGDLAASSNAEIPGEVIRPGLEMVIEIDPEGIVPSALEIPQRIPDTGRLEVDVREMPELDLTLIPFLWSTAPDSSIMNTVEAMAADPENHELLWATRTLLPVGDLRVTAHEPVVTSSSDMIELTYETRLIRTIEGATGHYMGLFPDQPELRLRGAALVGGRSSASVPHATTMAHELGHNMSLYHAPCRVSGPPYPHPGGSIGVWGYDFRDGGRLIRQSTPDLMSYCSPQWISDYHFVQALDYRLAFEGAPAAAGAENVSPVRSLLVWGGADADGIPFLEPAFVVDAPEAIPAPGSANELTGRSDDGGVLFSLSFDMPEIADGEGRAAFAFALPVEPSWARELASITLRGPGGAVTLDAATDRPMTILRNPVSGQVRAFLRHTPPTGFPGSAADVGALAMERGLEALFSRGMPEAREWPHD